MDFSELRYGMFVHFGLYSQLARGEWVMNREQIPPSEMEHVAAGFTPEHFDADAICALAVEGGMKYLVFTTMHHEGFRMYDSKLTPFNSMKMCGRDFVAEITAAARRHGLKIGLYHSLNNWYDQPDAAAALENSAAYETFIANTFVRLEELVTRFKPVDILWYDGWWPFNAEGWQGERMNEAMRKIQPQLIFNGRNGLSGDFGTPEGHISAPTPWRPWEACMTLNDHWGYHRSDDNWKSPLEVVKMLLTCGNGNGNLLLNIGPRGDGSIPEPSVQVIRQVGQWLRDGGREAVTANTQLKFDPMLRKDGDNADWDGAGIFTASGNNLFFTMLYRPGDTWVFTGMESEIKSVSCGSFGELEFKQSDGKVEIKLPPGLESVFAPVLKLECLGAPSIYRTGGMRVPQVKHPRYDPCPPDIQY